MDLVNVFIEFLESTGFAAIKIGQLIMLLVSFLLLYLAIYREFEPLLLVPIAFGMLLANLPLTELMSPPVTEIITDPNTKGLVSITKETGGYYTTFIKV